jgi:hypothetical protein
MSTGGGGADMSILLLDESLSIEVYYECDDCDWEDNICLRIEEDCPSDERLFRHDQTNIYLTRAQAQALAEVLLNAVRASREDSSPGDEGS